MPARFEKVRDCFQFTQWAFGLPSVSARIAQRQTKSVNFKTFSATTDTDACSVFDYFRAVGFWFFHLVWQNGQTDNKQWKTI